jgi:hypothetical protein
MCRAFSEPSIKGTFSTARSLRQFGAVTLHQLTADADLTISHSAAWRSQGRLERCRLAYCACASSGTAGRAKRTPPVPGPPKRTILSQNRPPVAQLGRSILQIASRNWSTGLGTGPSPTHQTCQFHMFIAVDITMRTLPKIVLVACLGASSYSWRISEPFSGTTVHPASTSRTGGRTRLIPPSSLSCCQKPRPKMISGRGIRLDVWAWVELNYRPHAYQACALTT